MRAGRLCYFIQVACRSAPVGKWVHHPRCCCELWLFFFVFFASRVLSESSIHSRGLSSASRLSQVVSWIREQPGDPLRARFFYSTVLFVYYIVLFWLFWPSSDSQDCSSHHNSLFFFFSFVLFYLLLDLSIYSSGFILVGIVYFFLTWKLHPCEEKTFGGSFKFWRWHEIEFFFCNCCMPDVWLLNGCFVWIHYWLDE